MAWVIGITDIHPRNWEESVPKWEDEQLIATSSHTFREVMGKLCETAIKKRREDATDFGIDEHLWNLIITSLEESIAPSKGGSCLDKIDDRESDKDDSNKYRVRPILIPCRQEQESRAGEDKVVFNKRNCEYLTSDTKISKELLPQESIVECTYDYGTTTKIFLKVLNVRLVGIRSFLQYFDTEANASKQLIDLKAVPAHQLPKEQQVDSYFPNFSKAFLGYYVPLIKKEKDEKDKDHDGGNDHDDIYDGFHNTKAIGNACLGLSARICRGNDTIFGYMEGRSCSDDLLFCPAPLELNEFLQVGEKSWTPRDPQEDPDKLHTYRHSNVCRLLVPSDNDEVYEKFVKQTKSESCADGHKALIYRLATESKKSEFCFQKVFPKTYAMLHNNKFRWFQYKKNILRVGVGRGAGHSHRDFKSRQILRTWKNEFESFHELLCAVEASWVWRGKELDPRTTLPDFDTDLGPSNPETKEPPCFGKERDSIVVSQCNNQKQLVTALAISEEAGEKMVLYSGHDDGTLAKWLLDDNTQIWTKKIYPGRSENLDSVFLRGPPCNSPTYGVTGIAVRPAPEEKGQHLIYTWSNAYEGYPNIDFEDRGPSKIKSWAGRDGSYQRCYSCDIGDDERGKKAYPLIATVVFCQLFVQDRSAWVDSIVVGLRCISLSLDWKGDYSQFDLESAQDAGEGNILPFYEYDDDNAMESWREDQGVVQAMAVIPKKYLLSYTIHIEHCLPEAMILWSLEKPGVPLYRYDFQDPPQSLGKHRQKARIIEVAGISVSGTEILFADETADRIVVVTVEDKDRNPSLVLHGYGNIGNSDLEKSNVSPGCMAMFGSHAVMAKESNTTAWIFNIEENWNHSKLDRHKELRYNDYGDDDNPYRLTGREIAAGKVNFPSWGDNAPKGKKRKRPNASIVDSGVDDKEEDKDDWLGKGGPLALAIRGKWIVAGFSNGTIARAPFLPAQFQRTQNQPTPCSNNLASCSNLSIHKWPVPVLEQCEDDDFGEEHKGFEQNKGCLIQ